MLYYISISYLVLLSILNKDKIENNNIIHIIMTFAVSSLIIAAAIYYREHPDMSLYIQMLSYNSGKDLAYAISNVRWEPGFVIYQWLLSQISVNGVFFIFTSSAAVVSIMIISFRKIASLDLLPFIMFGYLSFFYFYNTLTNVLRQGFAIAFILLMTAYLLQNKPYKALFALLAALSFHITSIVAVPLFLLNRYKIQIKYLIYILLFTAFLMLTGLNIYLIGKMLKLLNYGVLIEMFENFTSLQNLTLYGGKVNRTDFLLFTLFWAAWGAALKSYFLKDDKIYDLIIKAYILFSIVFTLFAFIAFSDRWAAYAWSLIPLLIWYPVSVIRSDLKLKLSLVNIIVTISLFYYLETYSYLLPVDFVNF